MPDFDAEMRRILDTATPRLSEDELHTWVARHFNKRDRCLEAWRSHGGNPLYLFDEQALAQRGCQFRQAFEKVLPETAFFYAIKSNNHPWVSTTLANQGFGIDVSSGPELQAALNTSARQIVFSGPGKRDDEISLALAHPSRVTLLIDSFGELARVSVLARGARVRAGVRLTPPGPHGWRKFGVPLDRLREFWETANTHPEIELCGIQFHTSWNMTSTAQIETIRALGQEIAAWPENLSRGISFLDIGGGYWPPAGEWLLPDATEEGRLAQVLGAAPADRKVHHRNLAIPIEQAARNLAEAIRREIFPIVTCRICFEPGRWLCNDAMHILISVVDRKEDDLVITDAGTNTVGWERFEQDYAPILNLTRPAMEERSCHILGSLCTPHDVWGYNYFGSDIQCGDVLLIPDQGAYTYSLRQHFIKSVPEVVRL